MTKTKVKNNHLTIAKNDDGTTKLIWDWDALLHEVRAATLAYESKQELKAEKTEKKAKINLVKETEAKVAKTRAKKVKVTVTDEVKKGLKKKGIDVNAEINAALTAEGAVADIKVVPAKKKPAAKKPKA